MCTHIWRFRYFCCRGSWRTL